MSEHEAAAVVANPPLEIRPVPDGVHRLVLRYLTRRKWKKCCNLQFDEAMTGQKLGRHPPYFHIGPQASEGLVIPLQDSKDVFLM